MLCLLLAVAAMPNAPLTLQLNAKVGDAWVYEMRERLVNVGEEFDETDVWREECRVARVETSGAVVELKRTLRHTLIGEDAIPPAKGTLAALGSWLLLRSGGRRVETPENATVRDTRLARLEALGVVYPQGEIEAGRSWSLEWAASGQVPRAKATWVLERQDRVLDRPAAAVSFRFVEDPAFENPLDTDGTFWVDVASGIVVGQKTKTRNFPVPGGSFAVDRVVERKLLEYRQAAGGT